MGVIEGKPKNTDEEEEQTGERSPTTDDREQYDMTHSETKSSDLWRQSLTRNANLLFVPQ